MQCTRTNTVFKFIAYIDGYVALSCLLAMANVVVRFVAMDCVADSQWIVGEMDFE